MKRVLMIMVLVLSGCVTTRPVNPIDRQMVPLIVEEITKNAGYSRQEITWTIQERHEVNAHISEVSHGGILMITAGLISRLETKDSDILRAICAHEIGHMRLDHGNKKKELGITELHYMPFEFEADEEAIKILRSAGHQNPDKMLIETLQ